MKVIFADVFTLAMDRKKQIKAHCLSRYGLEREYYISIEMFNQMIEKSHNSSEYLHRFWERITHKTSTLALMDLLQDVNFDSNENIFNFNAFTLIDTCSAKDKFGKNYGGNNES